MVQSHVRKAGQENNDDAAEPQVEHDRQGGDVAVPVWYDIWDIFSSFCWYLVRII